jgi:signal transduction histidine kinase
MNGIDALAAKPARQRRITGRIRQKDDASAEVSILDSGPGIPADRLAQVFEPFFTTKNQGMGMGLSISRTIVEAHGGRIWAENRIDGGAVFRLTLPLGKVQRRASGTIDMCGEGGHLPAATARQWYA